MALDPGVHPPPQIDKTQALYVVGLTERQLEVATLFAQGFDEDAIARRLWLAKNTVKTHGRKALDCLGLHRRRELREWREALVAETQRRKGQAPHGVPSL